MERSMPNRAKWDLVVKVRLVGLYGTAFDALFTAFPMVKPFWSKDLSLLILYKTEY